MITLEHNGTEQSLAAWGISLGSPQCHHVNLGVSSYSVFIPGASISAAPVFGFEEKIIIRRGRSAALTGGYVAFIGYQTGVKAHTEGGSEGVQFTFSNAWYFLENTAYMQKFASWNSTTHAAEFLYLSEVLLFTGLNGSNELVIRNSGQQISDVLGFVNETFLAQSMAQPFIIGTISPALNLPTYRVAEMMCAAVILKCLELSPDVQCVFDYTTSLLGVPTPTVHFYNRAALTARSLAIKNGTDHKGLVISPRYDLLVRSVVLNYRLQLTDGQEIYVTRTQDKYGPNGANHASDPERGLRVLPQTIELNGFAATAQLITEVADRGNNEWWKKKVSWLGSDRVTVQTITVVSVKDDDGTTVDLDDYPNEIISGAVTPWMNKTAKWVTIRGWATFIEYHTAAARTAAVAGLRVVQAVQREISVRLHVTDAATGSYQVQDTEQIPTGIAQAVYTSLATLQYEGRDVRVQAEVTNATNDGPLITLGHKLNLTGGLAAWATMGAQLQEITEHDGYGETSITFGPARHISAGDLAAMFQFNRLRRYWFNPRLRQSGRYGDNSGAVTGGKARVENSVSGLQSAGEDAVISTL